LFAVIHMQPRLKLDLSSAAKSALYCLILLLFSELVIEFVVSVYMSRSYSSNSASSNSSSSFLAFFFVFIHHMRPEPARIPTIIRTKETITRVFVS